MAELLDRDLGRNGAEDPFSAHASQVRKLKARGFEPSHGSMRFDLLPE
jgi:hypothetical protein